MVFKVRRWMLLTLVGVVVLGMGARAGWAWSSQGHILITRMAALRIIEDPQAPQGLRDFLKANMPFDRESCRKLALEESVGMEAAGYQLGLDNWCTMPDRVRSSGDRSDLIEPYGLPEAKMHFMDMEAFAKEFVYKDDLSNKPDIKTIPHDVNDPRWKKAGALPLRIEESYGRLVEAMASHKQEEALKWAGYLAHYLEDAHNPHHATVDYKSMSYLVGKVPGVGKGQKPGSEINPHADLEAQLFEPVRGRRVFREQFWEELNQEIGRETAGGEMPKVEGKTDLFGIALKTLAASYDYLPVIGRAAQAGYATGKFDAQAWFGYRGEFQLRPITLTQVIARRNAAAVILLEWSYRQAWKDAQGAGTSQPNAK